jgi:hypothetical protein
MREAIERLERAAAVLVAAGLDAERIEGRNGLIPLRRRDEANFLLDLARALCTEGMREPHPLAYAADVLDACSVSAELPDVMGQVAAWHERLSRLLEGEEPGGASG